MNCFLLIAILALVSISLYNYVSNDKYYEQFTRFSCQLYGDDYDSCYSDPSCTIGFLPNGDTHCMHKFLYEDI